MDKCDLGKTTVSTNIIKELHPEYEIFSFGQKIKDIAKDLFDMNGKNTAFNNILLIK